MTFFTTAGSKVFIGSVLSDKNDDFIAADFDGIEWTEIGSLTQIGTFGDTATPVTSEQINQARTKTAKGTRSAGTLEVVTDIDYADPGQLALLAAEKTNHNYAFMIEFNDAPPGAGSKNSTRFFIGPVMSATEALDQANSVMKLNASVAINSNIVRVRASAA